MNHIKPWRERLADAGIPADTLIAICVATEEEINELRAYIAEIERSPEDRRKRLVESLSPEERRQTLLTMLLKKIQHSRIVRPVKQIRILPEELREIELAVKPWMIEKTENLGIRKFEGVLLMEDHTAPSLLA